MKAVSAASLVLLLASMALTGCRRDTPGAALLGEEKGSVAGIAWGVPQRWAVSPERPMRVATYAVPPFAEDPEGGECGVFYFGSTEGGNVESNIERWIGQFEPGPTPTRGEKVVNDMKVFTVDLTGTFLAPAGPMMQSTGRKENYRLLGAIVAAPQGSVFFKLTGPAKTVESAAADFDAMISSCATP